MNASFWAPVVCAIAACAILGCDSGAAPREERAPEPVSAASGRLVAGVSFTLDGGEICPLCTGTGRGQYGSASRTFTDPFPSPGKPTSVALTVHAVACDDGTVTFTLDGTPIASRAYVEGNCFCGAACLALPRYWYVRPGGLPGWIVGGENHFNIVDTDGQFLSFDARLEFSDEYTLSPATAPSATSTLVTVRGTSTSPLPSGAPISVTFGGAAASAVARVDAHTVTMLAPPHAPGAVDVVLIFPGVGDRMTFTGAFAYEAPAPTTTVVVSSVNPSVSGQAVTWTATVTPTEWGPATGSVRFEDGTAGATLGEVALDGAGQASLTTAALAVGAHAITATYGGTSIFEGSVGALSQLVQKAQTTTSLASSTNPSVVGAEVTLTARVSVTSPGAGAPGGAVTFREGTTALGSAPLDAAGQAALATTALPVGAHAITAEWAGDASLAASASSALAQVVDVDATTVSLSSTPNPSSFGVPVLFTATVHASSTGGTPTGTVTFREGGTSLGAATLDAAGKATFELATLGVGAHTISARYEGDAAHAAASASLAQSIDAAITVVALTSAVDPSVFGQPVSLTATVRGPGGTPTGVVTLRDASRDGGALLGSATLNGAGQATFSIATLAVGTHALTATYGGDASFVGGAIGAHDQLVNVAGTATTLTSSSNPTVVGAPVAFTARVAPIAPGAGAPSGTVTLREGTTVLGVAPIGAAGLAVFSTDAAAGLPAGDHDVAASYGGDASFAASSSAPLRQTVAKDAVTTTLSAAPNPSIFGARVTFTAIVAAGSTGGTPGGTVTFSEGSAVLGSATLSDVGVGSWSTAALRGGSHAISATYGGDASHVGGSAGAVVQVVNVTASTTTLATSGTPTVRGQPVTLTATVGFGGDASLGAPTGSVELVDGTASLGVVALGPGGVCSLTTSALSVASHAISAKYGGDVSFAPSTAAALTQRVDRAGTVLTLVSSSNPVLALSEVGFTAVVAAKAPGAGAPTGVVTFRETAPAPGVLGTGALGTSGAAILSTSGLAVGSHELLAEYGGDGDFEPGLSSALTQSVSSNAASVTLSATPSPATLGDAITFTATVRGATRMPTGGVTFSEGTATLGAATLDPSGVARFTTATLGAGTRSVVATYGGDAIYSSGTGAAVIEVAKGSATTTLSAAPSPSRVGEVVSFEVRVSSTPPGAGGAVELFDGERSLGTQSLASGQAIFAAATLTQGAHAMHARYLGDESFTASASTTLTHEVSAAVAAGDDEGGGCACRAEGGAPGAGGAGAMAVAGVAALARARRARRRA